MSEPHTHAAPPAGARPAPVRRGRAAASARVISRRHRAAVPPAAAVGAERRRLLRLAVIPAALVAAVGVAVVGYLLRALGPASAGGTGVPWGVLAGALLLTGALVAGAAVAAGSEAHHRSARLTALRRRNAEGRVELQALVRRARRGERVPAPVRPSLPAVPDGDGLELLARELSDARHAAETAVAELAALARGGAGGDEEKLEVFVSLARRLQSLVQQEIEQLDELENDVEDPDLLKMLFHVDHLATRTRRHAENLAVLGGAVSRRQWSRPVCMTEVLRSAIAEVEHYTRVKLVPPIEGTLHGHAVADVIHLLAELVENATACSPAGTQVLLRAQHVAAGLAVEVEDRGVGMPAAEQNRLNALLAGAGPDGPGVPPRDGRIGMYVVAALARRHNIVVQLQSNIYGGVQAVLVLPHELLGSEPAARVPAGHADPGAAAGAAARPPLAAEPPPVQAPRPAEPAAPPPPVSPVSGAAAPVSPPSVASPSGTPAAGTPPAGTPAPAAPMPVIPMPPEPEPAGAAAPAPGPAAAPADAASSRGGGHPEPVGPEPASARTPAAGTPVPPAGEAGRPALPRRRRRPAAPERRQVPPAGPPAREDEAGHDPDLMAAFRRGAALAEGIER